MKSPARDQCLRVCDQLHPSAVVLSERKMYATKCMRPETDRSRRESITTAHPTGRLQGGDSEDYDTETKADYNVKRRNIHWYVDHPVRHNDTATPWTRTIPVGHTRLIEGRWRDLGGQQLMKASNSSTMGKIYSHDLDFLRQRDAVAMAVHPWPTDWVSFASLPALATTPL